MAKYQEYKKRSKIMVEQQNVFWLRRNLNSYSGPLFIVIAGSPARQGAVSEQESDPPSPASPVTPPPAKKEKKKEKVTKKDPKKKKGDASPRLSEESDWNESNCQHTGNSE